MSIAKKIGLRLGALTLGLVAALLLLEMVARIFNLGGAYFFRQHEYIGYLHIPNRTGWAANAGEGRPVKIKINSQGLRDQEYSMQKPAAVKRLLILGDSYAEAFQVELEDSFQEILETQLNAPHGKYRYEVINGGVSGFGTDNELLFYRHLGRRYSPDVVILAFVANDVRENSYEFEKQYKGSLREPYFVLENGTLVPMNYPFERKFAYARMLLVENLQSFYFMWRTLQFRRLKERAVNQQNGMPVQFGIYSTAYDQDWEKAWQLTKALLDQIKKEVAADGATFMVMNTTQSAQIYPEHREWFMENFPAMKKHERDWLKPNKILMDFCVEEKIPCLDLLPIFIDQARMNSVALQYRGGHWNEAGHRLAAISLHDFIEKRALLPEH